MYDFLTVVKKFVAKSQRYEYSPAFRIKPNMKQLMIRSRDYYCALDPETNLWITNEETLLEKIDKQVEDYVLKEVGESLFNDPEHGPIINRLSDTENHLIDKWHKFCQKDLRDKYEKVNQTVKFSNSEIKQNDFSTYVLPYPIQEGPTPYYDKLVDTLYLPDERRKFEYMLGCVLAGEQKKIQKLFIFFGDPGTGKSTIIDIIVKVILGYPEAPYAAKFTAELLASRDSFGTGFLAGDPVLAFDPDADLSRIESNTTLNLIVSHESVRVNAKFARDFTTTPNCILVCATNEPVQLSPNSGLNRRLIDIRPTGEKLSPDEYDDCMDHIIFEKSAIAAHCLKVYKDCGKNYYNKYVPENMLSMTSPFHNFVKDSYFELKDGTTLANAYQLYEQYCDMCNFKSKMTRYKFRDSLKLYFDSYDDQVDESGKALKNFYSGFKFEKIGIHREAPVVLTLPADEEAKGWLEFNNTSSLFDTMFADAPAQYSKEDGTPKIKWDYVKTTLKDLDTSKLHYVKIPKHIIVIDFDLKDETGQKSFMKNYLAALKFPPTYAELSKSGTGIHLHYIYNGGEPEELSRIYGDNIEIKVFTGNASLRRKLSKCNNLHISELSAGLPLKETKGGSDVIDWDGYKNEKILRYMILKNLNKEYHAYTKPSIDYIYDLLDKAYKSGVDYDLRDLKPDVINFALSSHNKADYCIAQVSVMHFCCKRFEDEELKDNNETEEYSKAPIIILDVESFPEDKDQELEALFLICWKYYGDDKSMVSMVNPSPKEVEALFKYRIVGHNVRDYDNHMLYAAAQGYTPAELNRLSNKIISGVQSAKFREAYNISFADTLDFASADNKKGLKKWENELSRKGKLVQHKELAFRWDKAVPKKYWPLVIEYCENDVRATEAVFKELQPDFMAREILAELSGLTINDKTNSHTIKILTDGIDNPQQYYIYTDLSKIFPDYEFNEYGIDRSRYKEGVKIVSGKSIFHGIDPSEGGRKIGYPGVYLKVGLFDVASMHPSSMIRLNLFGDEITKRLENLVKARIAIKHKDYDTAIKLLGEKVRKYLEGDPETLKKNAKALADALKTAINSVYGLTSASFDNKLRDPRNKDNIVAKYGALFMITLEEEITKMGYQVVHVSTDSIKVANVDKKIADFIMDYGKKYGFTFEYEALYSKMCLVNDAVYVARYYSPEACNDILGFVPGDNQDAFKDGHPWTATGKQFRVPYVYKSLFSHEPIEFYDLCNEFNTTAGALYLDFNEGYPDVTQLEKELDEYKRLVSKSSITIPGNTKLTDKQNKYIQIFKDKLGVPGFKDESDMIEKVKAEISKGHNYIFVGRTGLFTPVIDGCGGGVLYRIDGDRIAKASGTTGFRWFESSDLRTENNQSNKINRKFYTKLVDEAAASISEQLSRTMPESTLEWFLSDEEPPHYNFMNIPDTDKDEIPFEEYVQKTH